MIKAVRYYSKSGRTKKIAEAIAEGAGVTAVSINDEPELKEKADLLFLGGAPYANIMAPELKAYAEKLDKDMVGGIVLFTTSNWSKRTVNALRKLFENKGIHVEEDYFYAQAFKVDSMIRSAQDFGKRFLNEHGL